MNTSSLAPASSAVSRQSLPALARGRVLGIAAGFVALQLAVSARYGFHRDELYFLACARRLAWGYVDQPPLVPGVAWLATHTLGTSAISLRVIPALAGGVAIVFAALMARELGGGHKAQLLAALAAATSPQLLAAFHLLSTAAFDLAFWAAISFVVVRILRTENERLWLVVGALAGVALLNKFNVAFLLAALGIGLVVDGRARLLRSRYLWAGAVLVFLIWLPNIVWNAQHDWAAIAMLRSLRQENGGIGAQLGFIPSQIVVVGPVLVVFWVAGLRRLLQGGFARALAIAYLVLVVFFTVSGGKPYYLGGMYYVLFAAGGAWAEDRLDQHAPPRGVRNWVALMLIGGLVALPLTLPILPEQTLPHGSWEGNINKDLSATVGWKNFVGQVAEVANTLPPEQRANAVVFTGDYGAAGAVDLWGKDDGLPHAVSGHNSYWWWGPPRADPETTTIAIAMSRAYLLRFFSQCAQAGSVATPNNVWSEERGEPIWICRGLRKSWRAMWPAARHYG
jgi:4-amino-4-deoxy-L-arabinose transferase-like glycosyltransferase